MITKLLQKSGDAAVVSYKDYETGMTQARVISVKDLPYNLRIGQEVNISDDVLQIGTEYGIEWDILLGQSDVMAFLTQALRNHGVWTIEDLNKKPTETIAAINSSSARIYAELLRVADGI